METFIGLLVALFVVLELILIHATVSFIRNKRKAKEPVEWVSFGHCPPIIHKSPMYTPDQELDPPYDERADSMVDCVLCYKDMTAFAAHEVGDTETYLCDGCNSDAEEMLDMTKEEFVTDLLEGRRICNQKLKIKK